MRIVLLTTLFIGFAPALGGPSIAADQAPTSARLVLKNQQVWSVEILGRFFPDRMLLRREGEQGTIELPIADIGRIDLKLPAQAGELLDQYYAGDLDGAAGGLASVIAPYLDYITDANGNLVPLVQTLLKAYYHLGHHDHAIALGDHILAKTTRGTLHTDAICIKLLSLLAQGETNQVATVAGELESLTGAAARDAQVLFARASLHLSRNELFEAQELLARLITFQSRDFEWMPPALLLSAEGYARAGRPEVAQQIVAEIKLNFPGTRWIGLAEALDLRGREE